MINLDDYKLVSHIIMGVATIFIGNSFNYAPASASVLNYEISGDFLDGSSFLVNFSYETNATSRDNSLTIPRGIFDLLSFEIFIDETFFLSSKTEPMARLIRVNLIYLEPGSASLSFGPAIGIFESHEPGMFFNLSGVNYPNNVKQAPLSLATVDGIAVTLGGAVSPFPNFPKTVDSESVLISLTSVPESSPLLGLTSLFILSIGSRLKEKVKVPEK